MLIKRVVLLFSPTCQVGFLISCLLVIFGHCCHWDTLFFGKLFLDACDHKLSINTYGQSISFFSDHSSSIAAVPHHSWALSSQEPFYYVEHLLTVRSFSFHIKYCHLGFFSGKNFVSVFKNLFHTVQLLCCQSLIQFSSQIRKPKQTKHQCLWAEIQSVFHLYQLADLI